MSRICRQQVALSLSVVQRASFHSLRPKWPRTATSSSCSRVLCLRSRHQFKPRRRVLGWKSCIRTSRDLIQYPPKILRYLMLACKRTSALNQQISPNLWLLIYRLQLWLRRSPRPQPLRLAPAAQWDPLVCPRNNFCSTSCSCRRSRGSASKMISDNISL